MRVWDAPTRAFALVLGFFASAVLALSFLPAGNALALGPFTVSVLGKYLCFALLALSIDLAWGYLGILSLGHGAFFALGGYAFGAHLMRQIGDRGVYGSGVPDFMVFLGWEEYPWHWLGTDSFAFSLFMVFCAPGLLAFVFGWTAFRSRVSGVYFSIISQALTYALSLAFFLNALGYGGNNGFTDFKTLLGFDLNTAGAGRALFALSAAALLGAYLVARSLVASRLGLAMIAVRDNETRLRFVGYRVERVKLFVFTLSAMMAGLAGALYVPQAGIINPNSFAPLFSIEMVICVALGGRGRLYGAVIGAFLVNAARSGLSSYFPNAWLFAFGALFIAVPVALPSGVAGLIEKGARRLFPGRAASGPGAFPEKEALNG